MSSKARLETTENSMSVVNIAARQRMLSQRLVLQIVLAQQGKTNHQEEAENTLDVFESSHNHLIQIALQTPGPDGQRLRQLYFEPGHIKRTVDAFIEDTKISLHSEPKMKNEATLRLVNSTDTILRALNTITTAFDELHSAKEAATMRELKEIVLVIQNVAREAKIVAFNAQVIAARAGSGGREFSVIANTMVNISSEVDRLARQGVHLSRT